MRYPLKMRAVTALVSILAAWLAVDPGLALSRDLSQRKAFQRAHPCPATGKRTGACPGWVVDHVRPLCAGGPDHPSNMAWQEIQEAKRKDRLEAAECRALKKGI